MAIMSLEATFAVVDVLSTLAIETILPAKKASCVDLFPLEYDGGLAATRFSHIQYITKSLTAQTVHISVLRHL